MAHQRLAEDAPFVLGFIFGAGGARDGLGGPPAGVMPVSEAAQIAEESKSS